MDKWTTIPSFDPDLTLSIRWNMEGGTFEGKVFQDSSVLWKTKAKTIYEFGLPPLQPWFYLEHLIEYMDSRHFMVNLTDKDPIYKELIRQRDSESMC
jgi:hypothetical protein